MFLNDAFDVEFDRQYRRERPIPAGAVRLPFVWRVGLALLVAGAACLAYPGLITVALALGLIICIVIYDAFHKRFSLAPVLMGFCRCLVYLVAASTAIHGLTNSALAGGLALAAYVAGLSFVARKESGNSRVRFWPALLLAVPVVLALLTSQHGQRQDFFLVVAIVVLWIARSLRQTFWSIEPNPGRTVSLLLAGIVLVDWLAVSDAPREVGFVFIGLFLLALLAQRWVPAT